MLNENNCQIIESTIGYTFSNRGLLTQAFTRSSYRNEHPGQPDNEVLELIGDSVLSLAVLTFFREVYTKTTSAGLLTDWNEGKLSALKSALVNKRMLASRMKRLGLQKYLLLSKGDAGIGIENEESVMEDLFESIIGAIYVDSHEDFAVTSACVRQMLDLAQIVEESQKKVHISCRNDLQEWCQDKRRGLGVPGYTDTPLPDGSFCSVVRIPEWNLEAKGHGKNTKLAREQAAGALLAYLEACPANRFDRQAEPTVNYIGLLQEYCQAQRLGAPVYSDIGEEALSDHSYRFTVRCSCGLQSTQGTGSSKRDAKQQAAKKMLEMLMGQKS